MKDTTCDWQQGEFNAYSWHDNRIRVIRFNSPLEGHDHTSFSSE